MPEVEIMIEAMDKLGKYFTIAGLGIVLAVIIAIILVHVSCVLEEK